MGLGGVPMRHAEKDQMAWTKLRKPAEVARVVSQQCEYERHVVVIPQASSPRSPLEYGQSRQSRQPTCPPMSLVKAVVLGCRSVRAGVGMPRSEPPVEVECSLVEPWDAHKGRDEGRGTEYQRRCW